MAMFRCLLLIALHVLLPLLARADNDPHLARIIHKGNPHRIDRCMRRYIEREGRDHGASTYLHPLGGAEAHIHELFYDLRTQIGVNGVDWDRCVIRPAIWPGTWTLGVVFRTRDGKVQDILERCYTIQGGRPGTINLFGWRPHVRKDRDDLKVKRAHVCEGFLEEQKRICSDLVH
jgi:hypothetical protein